MRRLNPARSEPGSRLVFARLFERLDPRELAHVRRHVRLMQRRGWRVAALVLNWLSNGLLYPLAAAGVLALWGWQTLPAILVAGGSILAAHLIYPRIKTRCGRLRPFDLDPSIATLLKPLDRLSFPSGHTMTATAAFLPLSAVHPYCVPVVAAAVASIGWARLAAGHHYPSDCVAGALIGIAIASPGALWLVM
ncbi:MAG TPA: phosphatase PAP2 family protein [Stellaceae bacterium]|nr:phosphatase PAP2 family protein [Stellaceae bacterium]